MCIELINPLYSVYKGCRKIYLQERKTRLGKLSKGVRKKRPVLIVQNQALLDVSPPPLLLLFH